MSFLAKRITADVFHDALVRAGVVRDGEAISRVVIDARAGEPVEIHIQRFGDERLLEVARGLDGVEVREVHPPKFLWWRGRS